MIQASNYDSTKSRNTPKHANLLTNRKALLMMVGWMTQSSSSEFNYRDGRIFQWSLSPIIAHKRVNYLNINYRPRESVRGGNEMRSQSRCKLLNDLIQLFTLGSKESEKKLDGKVFLPVKELSPPWEFRKFYRKLASSQRHPESISTSLIIWRRQRWEFAMKRKSGISFGYFDDAREFSDQQSTYAIISMENPIVRW